MPYLILAVAFVTGSVSMILELVGSRAIAPYLGTSIFVWTSLIGVVLASLSLGYFLGGRLADKGVSSKGLSSLLLYGAILSTLVTVFEPVLVLLSHLPFGLRLNAVISCLFLFAPVTIALGMVTPYLARLAIKSVDTAGSAVGSLYSVSTLGSIVGTFLGGYVLVSYFGTREILVGVSLMLFALFAAVSATSGLLVKDIGPGKLLSFFVLAGASIGLPAVTYGVVADVDTAYGRWRIVEMQPGAARSVRFLTNNIFGVQSMTDMSAPAELLSPYTRTMDDLASSERPGYRSAVLLGAGGYSIPNHFSLHHPTTTLDVVEIDPALESLAIRYLGYRPGANVRTIVGDARPFLARASAVYDVAFVDTFTSQLSIPFHLTTVEATAGIERTLAPGGLAVVNVISGLRGGNARFLESLAATYAERFVNVRVVAVDPATDPSETQNIILLASDAPIRAGEDVATRVRAAGTSAFTDNFAPIERIVEESLVQGYERALRPYR